MVLLWILALYHLHVVVVFIKNNMVSHRLCDFMVAYTYYGLFYMLYNRRLFVKID